MLDMQAALLGMEIADITQSSSRFHHLCRLHSASCSYRQLKARRHVVQSSGIQITCHETGGQV